MQFNIVIRPFEGARPFVAGEIVDVSDWRHARSLTERRYIRPATVAEIDAATAAPVKRGRPSHAE
jgi:hypothetical protein